MSPTTPRPTERAKPSAATARALAHHATPTLTTADCTTRLCGFTQLIHEAALQAAIHGANVQTAHFEEPNEALRSVLGELQQTTAAAQRIMLEASEAMRRVVDVQRQLDGQMARLAALTDGA